METRLNKYPSNYTCHKARHLQITLCWRKWQLWHSDLHCPVQIGWVTLRQSRHNEASVLPVPRDQLGDQVMFKSKGQLVWATTKTIQRLVLSLIVRHSFLVTSSSCWHHQPRSTDKTSRRRMHSNNFLSNWLCRLCLVRLKTSHWRLY